MTETKQHHVTIKGVKDGLVFLLDDTCAFSILLEEIQHKLEKTHRQLLTGPMIPVHVKLGKRVLVEADREQLKQMFSARGNLLVQSMDSESPDREAQSTGQGPLSVMKGIVRSGQTIHHIGNLFYLGDVNPGGTITCTGDIFVMGALRGMAHAGIDGDQSAIIAASYLKPTQLRISEVVSRPPDEWGLEDAYMEFAYIHDGKMEIDKISQLHRLRPDHQVHPLS
ncbi:septum site-determining protein MinC [Paenibacillus koleovorans]|uniref:septum site-determining protein MinC n=1 Tax=Paenibacillus koleovorans TaxID=121608 RepID=UPI000FDA1DDB|nr:septum site-determining protein MinC [Paenibacillus koleovorans]